MFRSFCMLDLDDDTRECLCVEIDVSLRMRCVLSPWVE